MGWLPQEHKRQLYVGAAGGGPCYIPSYGAQIDHALKGAAQVKRVPPPRAVGEAEIQGAFKLRPLGQRSQSQRVRSPACGRAGRRTGWDADSTSLHGKPRTKDP